MKGTCYFFLHHICCLLLAAPCCDAQQKTLSIRAALQLVQSAQPQLKAWRQQSEAARHNVSLAKSALLPELTAGYQAGYATYNNITGMSYPGLALPISGPPSTENIYDPVPGTLLGAIVKWAPLTFGQRQAAVEKAAAQYRLATSYYHDALFRQQYAVISVYLDAVYLQKLLQHYQANITRTETSLQQSLVLAREGLRPGIDTAQFRAALAQAVTDQLIAQGRYHAQLSELARLINLAGPAAEIVLSDSLMAGHLPQAVDTGAAPPAHPSFLYQQARKELGEAALNEIRHAWRPRLDIWANAYARGSGVAADGRVHNADGWSLSRRNYGAGIQLSFPILQFAQVSLQKKQYSALLKADESQLDQVALNLRRQQEAAQYNYNQQRLIAAQASVQSQTARYAYEGLQLSYHNGLVDFTRLAQAQYELLRAETGEAGAFLQAWRALLDIAVAEGRLEIFTNQMK